MGIRTMAAALAVLAVSATVSDARSETRSLRIHHVNSRENWDIPFKKDGRYLPDGLRKLNHALRDWRTGQETKMDPRLLDVVWTAWKQSGSKGPIHVIGGYRSPGTNSMLRSRSANSGVAENSQHVKGRAMDFFIPDVPLKKMREIGLRLEAGGVGYYPKSGFPFVHLDVGSVRHWPRMSRKELVAVFPKGGTIHVPSDGRPLPGYEQAMAAYRSRGGTPAVLMAEADPEVEESKPGFLASLFGGSARRSGTASAVTPARTAAPAPAVAVADVAIPPAEAPRIPAVVPPETPRAVMTASLSVPVPRSAPADIRVKHAVEEASEAASRVAVVVPSARPAPPVIENVPETGTAFAALLARKARSGPALQVLAYGASRSPLAPEGSLGALEGLASGPGAKIPTASTPVVFDPGAPVLSLMRPGGPGSVVERETVPNGKTSRVRRNNSTTPPVPTALFDSPPSGPDPARFGNPSPAPMPVVAAYGR